MSDLFWVVQIDQYGEWVDDSVIPNEPTTVTMEDVEKRTYLDPKVRDSMTYGEWKARDLFKHAQVYWPDIRHRLLKREVTEEVLAEVGETRQWKGAKRRYSTQIRYNAVGLPYLEEEDQI